MPHLSWTMLAWRPLLWLCLAAALAPAAVAAPPGAPIAAEQARQWLARIYEAAHARNYQGILVFSADGALASSRVAHFCEGPQSYERVEALDGASRLTYRHNDSVYTVWPNSRVAVIEERDPKQASLRRVIEPRIDANYALFDLGLDRTAGRQARVLLLQPRDKHRFAHRVWVDSQSGLLLRDDVLGARQQVLESSAFSEVEIDIKPKPQSVLQPMKQLDGYRQVRPVQTATRLETQGWTLVPPVAGFQLSSCSLRALEPGAAPGAEAPALQAVFSDGLTHLSLFIERVAPQRPRRELVTQIGATHTLMRAHGNDWWITLMGDVPLDTLNQFYMALDRRP